MLSTCLSRVAARVCRCVLVLLAGLYGGILPVNGVAAPLLTQPSMQATAESLTLHDVVQQTLVRYPSRQIVIARQAQAQALRTQSERLFAGTSSFTLRHQTDAIGTDQGLREWEGGVELPLWLPGQRQARRAVADQTRMDVDAFERVLRLEVAGQVREQLWDVVLRESDLILAQRQWQAAQALEADVLKRVTLGELARTNLFLAQDETLSRQAQVLRAESEYKRTMHRYEVFTGAATLPAGYNEIPTTQTAIHDHHPLLSEGYQRVTLARAEMELARQERYGNPRITLGVRQEQASTRDFAVNSVGVMLSVPFGNSAQAGVALAAASVEFSTAQSVRDTLKRELTLTFEETRRAVELLRVEHKLAVQQQHLAEENLRLSKKAFAVGEIDVMDLLRVQALSFTAERAEKQLSLQLQREFARYNQVAGVIP